MKSSHRHPIVSLTTAVLCVHALAGCALEDGDPAGDDLAVDTVEESVDTPSTLTIFSEANFTGDQLVASLTPSSDAIATKGIYAAEMQAAHMVGRASSARLQCGTRPTDAYFFGSDGFFAGEWVMISCAPGATTQVNLHVATSTPGHKILGDKVVYGLLSERTTSSWPIDFASKTLSAWDAQIGSFLGSGASPDGVATIAFKWVNQFRLRQAVHISTPWYCEGANGWFEYSAGFTMGNPGLPNWAVYGTSGVSGGWPCHDDIASAFKSKVIAGQATFATMLNSATNLGSYASYYFVPNPAGVEYFDLAFGPL